LADCLLAEVDLSPIFAHGDKETYHVADGADWHGRIADAEHRRADEMRAGAAEEPMDRMGEA
jgi:hypothetical protein